MDKFDKLTGIAAPMPLVNIDTDMIIPKVFLKTIKRSGLGVNLFDEMRYDRQGNEIEDFVLNRPAYREAKIIVASYGLDLARKHSEDCRKVMESRWYQQMFPATQLARKGNTSEEIRTTRGGVARPSLSAVRSLVTVPTTSSSMTC